MSEWEWACMWVSAGWMFVCACACARQRIVHVHDSALCMCSCARERIVWISMWVDDSGMWADESGMWADESGLWVDECGRKRVEWICERSRMRVDTCACA